MGAGLQAGAAHFRNNVAASTLAFPNFELATALQRVSKCPRRYTTTIEFGSLSQANDGDTLDVGGQYAVLTSAAAFTVSLPVWASQSSRVSTPIVIENLSGSDVTLEVNAADATTTYAGIGGSSVTLAGGERGELRTALDGAAQVWVLRTI